MASNRHGDSPGLSVFEGRDPVWIDRYLAKQVDPVGIPRRLPVGDWASLLRELADALLPPHEPWPDSLRDRIRGLLLATLRFTRPDGSAIFGSKAGPGDLASLLRRWVEIVDEPGVATVAQWWFGRRGRSNAVAPPPLPAWGEETRPIAILRPDWRADGDFLAIDHRSPGEGTLLELQASGKTLLGPSWISGLIPAGKARGAGWSTGMHADRAEWTFREGTSRVVRTAVLLRGQKLALLAEEWHGIDGEVSIQFATSSGVEISPVKESRSLSMKGEGVSARAIPLGLPALPYPTERGSFLSQPGSLLLRQKAEAQRLWIPLLISWDKARNRRVPQWRRLTVSERSKNCPPGVAFAVRVGWGPGDGLVIYRSLSRPGLRTFLGHQTSAKFLIGLFNENGNVVPLLKIDE